jgi:hypothetical protein
MDLQECAKAYGPEVGRVCQRAVQAGWDAATGAGWLSALAVVIAGFVFAALVATLSSQRADGALEEGQAEEPRIQVGDSLAVFLGSFLSLLMAALFYSLVSAEFHPLRIGAAAGIATAVFAAGAVQTFVAITWLFLASPRTTPSFGALKVCVRYVMFASGLYLYVTVHKAQSTTSLHGWSPHVALLFVAFLVLPWVVARAISHSEPVMAQIARPQVTALRISVAFLAGASVVLAWVIDRSAVSVRNAFPMWLAGAILLSVGLLYAAYELNLPRPIHLHGTHKARVASRQHSAKPESRHEDLMSAGR